MSPRDLRDSKHYEAFRFMMKLHAVKHFPVYGQIACFWHVLKRSRLFSLKYYRKYGQVAISLWVLLQFL